MMLPVDNKLTQPPNSHWQDISTVAYGRQLAFTDSSKTYVWIGYVADENAPLPALDTSANVPTKQTPAFWSELQDQA
jgi:hypothetical protein